MATRFQLDQQNDKHTVVRWHEHAVGDLFMVPTGARAKHLRRHALQNERQSKAGACRAADDGFIK